MSDRTRAEIRTALQTLLRLTVDTREAEHQVSAILAVLDAAGFKIVRKPRALGAPTGKAGLVAVSARLDAVHGTPFDRMRGR